MQYFLRAIFILSFFAWVICSLITWQQWSPFTPGYPDHRNFLQTADHVAQAAKFLFFAAALLEAWIGSLDKRISALALGAFIVEHFGQLGATEKNILLGIAIACAILLFLLVRYKPPSPHVPHRARGRVRSVDLTPDTPRPHSPVKTSPPDITEPQPPF